MIRITISAPNFACQGQHVENAKDVNNILMSMSPKGPPPTRQRTRFIVCVSEISMLSTIKKHNLMRARAIQEATKVSVSKDKSQFKFFFFFSLCPHRLFLKSCAVAAFQSSRTIKELPTINLNERVKSFLLPFSPLSTVRSIESPPF